MVYATFYFLFLFIYCRFIFFMFFFFFFIFFVFFLFFFYFYFFVFFFFFQAEDGIRDRTVMEFRRVLFRSADDALRRLRDPGSGGARLPGAWGSAADARVGRDARRLLQVLHEWRVVGLLLSRRGHHALGARLQLARRRAT